MPSKAIITYLDHDSEVSTVTVQGVTITDVNYTAQNAAIDALIAALANVTLCAQYKSQRVYTFGKLTLTPPASQLAQREKKWLVHYHDDVTLDKGTFEIPGADLTLLDAQARGEMDQSDAAYIALVAAIEAYMISKAGNSVTVDKIVFVGRNI